MANFMITRNENNRWFTYTNENVYVDGAWIVDDLTSQLIRVEGRVSHIVNGESGDYIGNFVGIVEMNELVYQLSKMSRANTMLTWAAIDDIEQEILGSGSSSN